MEENIKEYLDWLNKCVSENIILSKESIDSLLKIAITYIKLCLVYKDSIKIKEEEISLLRELGNLNNSKIEDLERKQLILEETNETNAMHIAQLELIIKNMNRSNVELH